MFRTFLCTRIIGGGSILGCADALVGEIGEMADFLEEEVGKSFWCIRTVTKL